MTGVIDWAASRARMIVAFVILSLTIGAAAYIGLPKEGEPDIDIPGLFVSVPFPGISAEDSERLLIRPMESEFQDLDGLTTITSTASEGFAGLFLEFEFGWDKSGCDRRVCATRWAGPRRSFPTAPKAGRFPRSTFPSSRSSSWRCLATRPSAR